MFPFPPSPVQQEHTVPLAPAQPLASCLYRAPIRLVNARGKAVRRIFFKLRISPASVFLSLLALSDTTITSFLKAQKALVAAPGHTPVF